MDTGFSMRPIYLSGILSLVIVLFVFFKNYFDTRTTLVFCDVGQGDGAYIRVDNRIDVVVDAGPDNRILDCLGKYMPFYDHTIELAFLSHPQKDHFGGYLAIFERYKVGAFLLSPVNNPATSFQALKNLINRKSIQTKPFYKGDVIYLGNAMIRAVWPNEQFVNQNVIPDGNRDNFHETRIDFNNFSQVFLLTKGTANILFTGDLTPASEHIMLKEQLPVAAVLKVPHHGSKNGLIESFLKTTHPKIAVISVGKNNSFDQPSPEIIKMLEKNHVQIKRTDQEGDIVYKLE